MRMARRPIALALEDARGLRRVWLMGVKAFLILRSYGVRELVKRSRRYVARRGLWGAFTHPQIGDYQAFVRNTALRQGDVDQANEWLLAHESSVPTIGLVMPIYRPSALFLQQALDSVRSQVSSSWRLVLSMDGPAAPEIEDLCASYATEDPRITCIRSTSHEGISAATNAGAHTLSTDWVAFMDQDDVLNPRATYLVQRAAVEHPCDIVYTDEDKVDDDGRRFDPFFKPDWSPHLLLSMNYVSHFLTVKSDLFRNIGGLRSSMDGSQDYDLLLRATERPEVSVCHVPQVLYHWRVHPESTSGGVAGASAKPQAYVAAEAAIREALQRRGRTAEVEQFWPGRFRIRYAIGPEQPLVSIIIPFRDRGDLLRTCLTSIARAAPSNVCRFEIVLVDNGSHEDATFRVLDWARATMPTKVVHDDSPFNFSRLINAGARASEGDFLLLLNNDTEVLTPDWLDLMVGVALESNVGAVGPKLLFGDGRIQHAGIIMGLGGVAGHAFYGREHHAGYMDLLQVTRDVSAVTGACLLTRAEAFFTLNGFREELKVAFNDVDYCLRLLRDHFIVFTPQVEVVHDESASRSFREAPEDIDRFVATWAEMISTGDAFYNPHLSVEASYEIKRP